MDLPEIAKRPQEDSNGVYSQDVSAISEPAAKKLKLDEASKETTAPRPRVKGVAPIKPEYLILAPGQAEANDNEDDDEAEGRTAPEAQGAGQAAKNDGKRDKRKKFKGQNKDREFGTFSDAKRLCNSVAWTPEFSPRPCKHGDRCNAMHDIRKYLAEGRRPDLTTFDGKCPVWDKYGRCSSGWRCLFVRSHMDEVQRDDGRTELVLLVDTSKQPPTAESGKGNGGDGGADDEEEAEAYDARHGIVNSVPVNIKMDLSRKRITLDKSDKYLEWLAKDTELYTKHYHAKKKKDGDAEVDATANDADLHDYRANYVEPPLLPSEKRRVYFGPETPILAPLTTVGNLPFRRLCVELGAQLTYSEMALGLPLLQGQKADWTLMRAHESELAAPRFSPNPGASVVQGYDNSRDLRFGAQIAANVPWIAIRVTEALSRFLPHLRLIDLNCGCPVDAVYKSGGGSALLDAPSKLERMIRGMNTVSGEVPVTAKIRIGVRDDRPIAQRLVERLGLGSEDMRGWLGAPGCAAVTLHGRTRQQRYTRAADWSYIAECAALVKRFRGETAPAVADTVREPDPRTLPANGGKSTQDTGVGSGAHMYFIGNGDVFSHHDYFSHISNSGVDAIMVGRGALVKPWIFEEIEKGQYLDKSSSERLEYVAKFARYGMEAWGSDELGLNYTRRFLLEFLSFFTRYVPVGLLEHLPPSLNDRPPAYRGRDELETLLASKNYKDWIKISEMFLGPAPPGFKFQPKHKSNSYEAEG
ncbi:hypothetical protein VTJ83DRAFT_452 [Remersonia thermophila]|uniref:tRNA-dihydrouridine(47) synthase [NAD(P)(+)] n=1 Tax=Remersonia thermophila TaxID=72144 RepID=A0ABR4DL14_9PEZI